MTKKGFLILAVSVLLALTIGVAYNFIFSESIKRKKNPEKYVTELLMGTYSQINFPKFELDWVFDIQKEKHEVEFSVAPKEIDLPKLPFLKSVDPQVLSMAQMGKVNFTAVRSPKESLATVDASVYAAGTEIIGVNTYLSDSELAVKVPKGFDYFVTLDPKLMVSVLNSTPIAQVVSFKNNISDEALYGIYSKLFKVFEKPSEISIDRRKTLLFEGAQYSYVGVEKGVYEYELKIDGEKFNTWYNFVIDDFSKNDTAKKMNLDTDVMRNFSVSSELTVKLYEYEGTLQRADISTKLQNDANCVVKIEFKGEKNIFDKFAADIHIENPSATNQVEKGFSFNNAISPYVMLDEMPTNTEITVNYEGDSVDSTFSKAEILLSGAAVGTTNIRWDFSWDKKETTLDNFKFDSELKQKDAFIKLNVLGNVLQDKENKKFLSSFSDISYQSNDYDGVESILALELKCNIKAVPDAVIDFDRSNATKLLELTPIKLLKIYSNFSKDPIIGNLIKGM